MSLALATKGVIAGFGGSVTVSGEGGGGIYPSGYVACAIQVAIDLTEQVVSVDSQQITATVEMEDAVTVTVNDVSVSVPDDSDSVSVDV
jgi:hypothetical protein